MERTDVIIVGAGPIGIEMALALRKASVDYLHLEAEMIGRTLYRLWPRNTRFLSAPDEIAIPGVPVDLPDQDRLLGEQYLAYLRSVIRQFDLPIRQHERVVQVEPVEDGFYLQTRRLEGPREYRCRRLILATGDMAAPRKLGIPGEDLPHVHHGFDDPHEFFGQQVLIVGGRNSAVEAALRFYRAGVHVALCHRRRQLEPRHISHKLFPVIQPLIDKGRIGFHGGCMPAAIRTGSVTVSEVDETFCPTGRSREIAADRVVVLVGFAADVSLMKMAGVDFESPVSAPTYNPDTMESNVPGLYIVGTAASGTRSVYEFFIETSHRHVARIRDHLLASLRRPVRDRP